MLSKKTFKQQIKRLSILYPNWRVDISDKDTMKVWYNEFKEMNDEQFEVAIEEYINNEVYTPTIAGIKNQKTYRLPKRKDEFL